MVYKKNFVVVIKSRGKILREGYGNAVYLPFGSEYSILLKNLHSKNALVSISIDGLSVGPSLIIKANSSVDLERFYGNNLVTGRKFKFIQKTKEIVEHRGDKIDDGMVRVEIQYEADKVEYRPVKEYDPWYKWKRWDDYKYVPWRYYPPYYDYTPIQQNSETWCYNINCINNNNICGTVGGSSSSSPSNNVSHSSGQFVDNYTETFSNQPEIMPDEGITVKGSKSNQRFYHGYIGELENNSEVIILRLKGINDNKEIYKPITVKTKLVCEICGKHNKSNHEYCSKCGAALKS